MAFEPVRLPDVRDHGDELLRRWRKTSQEAYYLDGGVLNNKPFSFTIYEIFHPSIAADLDSIAEHNDRVARRKEIYNLIGRDATPPIPDCLEKTVGFHGCGW